METMKLTEAISNVRSEKVPKDAMVNLPEWLKEKIVNKEIEKSRRHKSLKILTGEISKENYKSENVQAMVEKRIDLNAEKRVEDKKQEVGDITEAIEKAGMKDALTGIYNRGFLDVYGPDILAHSERIGESVAVVMLDLDHFKYVNDEHGHQAGDDVLKKVAEIMRKNVREGEIFGRYGGEEFYIILQGISSENNSKLAEEGAKIAVERYRKAIEDEELLYAKPNEGSEEYKPTTASFGVAVYIPRGGEKVSLEELLKSADEKLYKAKDNGRNRVEVEVFERSMKK